MKCPVDMDTSNVTQSYNKKKRMARIFNHLTWHSKRGEQENEIKWHLLATMNATVNV